MDEVLIPFISILSFVIFLSALSHVYAQISGYDLVETLTIEPNGEPVSSKVILENELEYKIRVSGEVEAGGGAFGDAEYLFRHKSDGSHIPAYTNTATIQTQCPGPNATDMGIGINDIGNDASKSPFWGGFENTHVYTIDLVGRGAPITVDYHDCVYSDNSGLLTLEIFRPIVRPENIWADPLTLTIIGGVIAATGGIIAALMTRSRRK